MLHGFLFARPMPFDDLKRVPDEEAGASSAPSGGPGLRPGRGSRGGPMA